MKRNLGQAGFTLVEILVVVSILLVSIGIAGDLIISVIRSYNKARILNEIEQNANFVLSKISYDLKNARSLDSVSASLLRITDQTGTQIEYTIESSSITGNVPAVTRKYGNGVREVMTNNDPTEGVAVSISASGFSQVSNTPPAVKSVLSISQGSSSLQGKSAESTTVFEKTEVLSGVSF